MCFPSLSKGPAPSNTVKRSQPPEHIETLDADVPDASRLHPLHVLRVLEGHRSYDTICIIKPAHSTQRVAVDIWSICIKKNKTIRQMFRSDGRRPDFKNQLNNPRSKMVPHKWSKLCDGVRDDKGEVKALWPPVRPPSRQLNPAGNYR